MSFNYSLLFCMATFGALASVFIHRTHFLMCLLGLEGAILSIVLICAVNYGGVYSLGAFICIVLLTFGACEASLGLSLLVFMARSHGSDLVKSVCMVKCLSLYYLLFFSVFMGLLNL